MRIFFGVIEILIHQGPNLREIVNKSTFDILCKHKSMLVYNFPDPKLTMLDKQLAEREEQALN